MARRRDFLIDKNTGSVIRMQRVKLGMSQTELGEALGVSFQQIQKYERRGRPTQVDGECLDSRCRPPS